MENYYANLVNLKKYEKQTIIFSLFKYIAECIINIISNLKKQHEFSTIIIAGGVASNRIIRRIVTEKLNNQYEVIFPSTENSSDNAIGVAFMPLIDRWYNEAKTN
jgi:N6-L-threonylcarbamoyladenine synthase